jgi:hypothetical protein
MVNFLTAYKNRNRKKNKKDKDKKNELKTLQQPDMTAQSQKFSISTWNEETEDLDTEMNSKMNSDNETISSKYETIKNDNNKNKFMPQNVNNKSLPLDKSAASLKRKLNNNNNIYRKSISYVGPKKSAPFLRFNSLNKQIDHKVLRKYNKRVILNCGGVRYETYERTLRSLANSRLANLVKKKKVKLKYSS